MQEWSACIADLQANYRATYGEEMPAELQARLLQDARAMVVSTPKAPTRAGFTKLSATVEHVKPAKVLRFPKMTDEEKIAESNAPCENCTGDCRKSDKYWIVTGFNEIGVEAVRRCKFGVQRDLAKKFRSSRIPNRYLGKTFDDYKVDKFNQDAVTFAKNFKRFNCGAYFFGECGTGKTFLAALMAQDFLQDGKSVLFAKVPSLLDDIKATFNGNGTELDLLDELRAANLVVLDDFGMEKSTQWAGSTLCKILDMRYDNPTGRTIITSNLSPKDLAEHLNKASDGANLNGSRIFDRLREICKPILLKGTTRRN